MKKKIEYIVRDISPIEDKNLLQGIKKRKLILDSILANKIRFVGQYANARRDEAIEFLR